MKTLLLQAVTQSGLCAIMRPTGRVLDTVRYNLGGSDIFEASFPLGKLVDEPGMNHWEVHLQRWPGDVLLRKELLSAWSLGGCDWDCLFEERGRV